MTRPKQSSKKMQTNNLRIVPDGKPFSKGERAWYKLDGCEHWMIFESTMDGNLTSPASAPFIWKHVKEDEYDNERN